DLFDRPSPDLPGVPKDLLDVLRVGMANAPAARPSAEEQRDDLAALPAAVPAEDAVRVTPEPVSQPEAWSMPTQPRPVDLATDTLPPPAERTTEMRPHNGESAAGPAAADTTRPRGAAADTSRPDAAAADNARPHGADTARPRRWSAFGAGVAILVLALIATAWYAAARGPVHRLTFRPSVTGAVLTSRAVAPLLIRAL